MTVQEEGELRKLTIISLNTLLADVAGVSSSSQRCSFVTASRAAHRG